MSAHRFATPLAVLGLAASIPLLASPAQQPPAAAPVPPLVREGVTVKVSDHVYVIPDDNVPLVPNVGIVVGSRSTLIVDTGLGARNGETVMREVEKVAKGPHIFLVTTHVHPEHDLGAGGIRQTNMQMLRSKAQVDEIASGGLEMAKRFATFSPLHAELLKDAAFRPADMPPFDTSMDLDLGGVRVKVLAMGFNHTRGDTAIYVETDRVLFSGDVSMTLLPSVGNGASLDQWIASQNTLAALKPLKVVPSHGPMGDAAIMEKTKAFVATVQRRAAELKKAGKTLDETLATLQTELAPTFGATPRMASGIRAAYNQAP